MALGYPLAEGGHWRPWLSNNTGGNGTGTVAIGYTQTFGGESMDYRFATGATATFKPLTPGQPPKHRSDAPPPAPSPEPTVGLGWSQ